MFTAFFEKKNEKKTRLAPLLQGQWHDESAAVAIKDQLKTSRVTKERNGLKLQHTEYLRVLTAIIKRIMKTSSETEQGTIINESTIS